MTRLQFGLRIERDLHLQPRNPLSVYAAAAWAAGRVVEHGPELEAVSQSPGSREKLLLTRPSVQA